MELEITESATNTKEVDVIEILHAIKEAGFRVSLDDFGTGYSSLSMLQDAPIDVLKIDKAFIDKVSGNTENKNMIEYVLFIAKNLHLKTVVEGVETEEQVLLLRRIGCDMMQGYYYAKPMRIEEFEACFLEEKKESEE